MKTQETDLNKYQIWKFLFWYTAVKHDVNNFTIMMMIEILHNLHLLYVPQLQECYWLPPNINNCKHVF